jgi:hypothetical protein
MPHTTLSRGSRRARRARRLARVAVAVAFAVAGRAEPRSTRIAAGVLAVLADRMLAPPRAGGAFVRRGVVLCALALTAITVAAALLIRRRRAARGSAPAR